MTRVISAGVLLALIIGTVWFLPVWATAVLATVAAVLAGDEMTRIASHANAPVSRLFVGVASGLVVIAFLMYALPAGAGAPALGAVVMALVVGAATLALAGGPPTPSTLTQAAAMTMAPLYAGLPLGAIAWVQWALGPAATSWLLAVIAVSDSAQYYTGRAFGRTKLAPIVSPSKTREGAVGGLLVAAAAGFLLGPICLPALPPLASAGLAATLAIFGIVGDLFESALKRSVNLKDSSSLIPGHGGVLDRIDSHLFASPIFYLLIRYLT